MKKYIALGILLLLIPLVTAGGLTWVKNYDSVYCQLTGCTLTGNLTVIGLFFDGTNYKIVNLGNPANFLDLDDAGEVTLNSSANVYLRYGLNDGVQIVDETGDRVIQLSKNILLRGNLYWEPDVDKRIDFATNENQTRIHPSGVSGANYWLMTSPGTGVGSPRLYPSSTNEAQIGAGSKIIDSIWVNNIQTNINMNLKNVTNASYFIGNGSLLTDISTSAITDIWVNETGDTMTGPLNVTSRLEVKGTGGEGAIMTSRYLTANSGGTVEVGQGTDRIDILTSMLAGGDFGARDENSHYWFYFDANKDMGLGTTDPEGYKLNVNGTINSNDNISALNYLNSSGDLEWIRPEHIADVDDEDIETDLNTYVDIAGDITPDGANFTFDTSDNILHIDSTNNRVGIGTTSPNEMLEVAGNIAVTGRVGDDVYIFKNAGSGIRIRSDSLTTQWFAGDDGPAYFGTVSNDDLLLSTNGITRMTIKSGLSYGNVGIGTTTPSEKLTVVGNGSFTGNVTADWFKGSINYSNVQNHPEATDTWVNDTGDTMNGTLIIDNETTGADSDSPYLFWRGNEYSVAVGDPASWIVASQADFNEGTYNRTFYNTSGFVQLNLTYTSGNYTSKILDSANSAVWSNITWIEGVPYQEELPNNKGVETVLGGANMTGNVLLFHFNNDSAYGENDSLIYDFSGTGNNGTPTGGVIANTTGKFGNAYWFDGTDDYINVPDDDSLDFGIGDFTLVAWLKTGDSDNRLMTHLKGSGNYEGYYYDTRDGHLYGLVSDAGTCYLSGAKSVTDNQWHHVVFVADRDVNGTFYVDGVFDTTTVISTCPGDISNAETLRIGRTYGSGTTIMFNGTMDEVSIWNRSLSATEILDIYKRGALNLNITTRSCNDAACSGEAWNETHTNASIHDLHEKDNRYFQFLAQFRTNDSSYAPELYNLTINYLETGVTNTEVDIASRLIINSLTDYRLGFFNYLGTEIFSIDESGNVNATGDIESNSLTHRTGGEIVDSTGDLAMDNLEPDDFDATTLGYLGLVCSDAGGLGVAADCDDVCGSHGLACGDVYDLAGDVGAAVACNTDCGDGAGDSYDFLCYCE